MTVATAAPPYLGHILLDVPAAEPALGYDKIAEALAAIVEKSEPRFAVGIFGSWGSGKSTLMDSLAARIDRDHAVVVPFNAWQYERESHVVLPLLDTIRAGLSAWAGAHPEARAPAENIALRIGRVVRALARGLSVQVGLPGAITVGMDADRVLETLQAGTAEEQASPQSVYFAAFSELKAAFEEVRAAAFTRIVVFVDDLDRCLPASALSVIESMKLFFDLPGFVFVIGMDPRVVERAVRVKFREEMPAGGGTDAGSTPERDYTKQLEREYVKKIIQVQCTLPEMVPAQLDELLEWVDRNVTLGAEQRSDLTWDGRVRRYLFHVAAQGRINPRQVKRFVNAYTLQRMIQTDLDADALLALQVLEFRPDWESVRDVLLAEPDVFLGALLGYRGDGPEPPDDHALENLWPQLAVLPAELSAFLRSPEVAPLVDHRGTIDRYLSSLGSTSSIPDSLRQAFRNVGQLRQQVRELSPEVRWGSARAREAAERMQALCERILGYASDFSQGAPERIGGPVQRIQASIHVLSPSGGTEPRNVPPDEFALWREKAMAAIDQLQEEFRLLRRSTSLPSA